MSEDEHECLFKPQMFMLTSYPPKQPYYCVICGKVIVKQLELYEPKLLKEDEI